MYRKRWIIFKELVVIEMLVNQCKYKQLVGLQTQQQFKFDKLCFIHVFYYYWLLNTF